MPRISAVKMRVCTTRVVNYVETHELLKKWCWLSGRASSLRVCRSYVVVVSKTFFLGLVFCAWMQSNDEG